MTLRELQEALEEEVLTRQSLSREMEAIRTANQNFARSGSGRRVGLYSQQPVWLRSGRAHGLFLPAVSSVRPRPGTETWRRTSGSCRSGWSCCRPGETQASPSRVPFPEGDGGGEVGPRRVWTPGGGRGAQAGARRATALLRPSTRPMPLSSPSSCHGGPQSPGHGSTFPCKTPLFPLYQACWPLCRPRPRLPVQI